MSLSVPHLGTTDVQETLRRFQFAIAQIAEGRTNAVGSVTLAANAASTTVAALTCMTGSFVFLSPQTANAAAALATTYVQAADITKQQFVITHANNAQTDKTFGWVVLG